MILTKDQIDQLQEASKPLMKFLSENFDPHTKVIVENNNAEIVFASARVICDEFTLD